jgi:hypothetical protein
LVVGWGAAGWLVFGWGVAGCWLLVVVLVVEAGCWLGCCRLVVGWLVGALVVFGCWLLVRVLVVEGGSGSGIAVINQNKYLANRGPGPGVVGKYGDVIYDSVCVNMICCLAFPS